MQGGLMRSRASAGATGRSPRPATRGPLARRTRFVVRAQQEDEQEQKQKRGVRGLEDFVLGGPKLRKWYGAEDGVPRPRDGGSEQAAAAVPEDNAGPREVVLVTDGESAMGEQVVLQLILARAKVRLIVNDVAAAKAGYGPYVDAVSADVNGGGGLARAMRGVRTVVALGRLGKLLPAAKQAGVERVVLLSTAGMPQPGGLAALFGGGGGAADAALRDPAREQQLAAAGLPYVVLKTGPIRDAPGGGSALQFSAAAPKANAAAGPAISREDLACAAARLALDVQLPEGAASTVVVAAAGPGAPPQDWAAELQALVAA